MWELLAVLVVYLIVSFVGMAALWTVAARKGVVRAPDYFFWVRRDQHHMLPTASGPTSSSTFLNFRPAGLAAATASILRNVRYASYRMGWARPNQTVRANAII